MTCCQEVFVPAGAYCIASLAARSRDPTAFSSAHHTTRSFGRLCKSATDARKLPSLCMADQKSAEPKTLEFRIEVTVGKTTATVTLTLKSTAVVADVQTKIVTDQPPRDER